MRANLNPMTIPSLEQLDSLSREELLPLVKALVVLVTQQAERIAQLEKELASYRKPPADSSNSSHPPSKDKKSSAPRKKKKKKHGPPFGHKRHTRPLVANPDQVVVCRAEQCSHCQTDLRGVEPESIIRHQVTEIPIIKPLVIETQQHKTRCPHCRKRVSGPLPEGLEADRFFGPQLEATVVYYKQRHHLSYVRIVEVLRDRYGISISEGAVAQILERAGKRAAIEAEKIRKQVVANRVIRSDETSARVEGKNWWQWVFVGDDAVYHTIVPTRSAREISTVMGEACAEFWVCDCYGAQLNAPAKVIQLCLQHQLRDLKRILDASPNHPWAGETRKLFQAAIHFHNRFLEEGSKLTIEKYVNRVFQFEEKLDALLAQPVPEEAGAGLQRRLIKHRDKLFVFLHYPGIPPTNNESEQALRTSVIYRKVTNGFRSQWGAQAYAAVQTVVATVQRKGQCVFQALVKLMGPPVLHYFEASSP
jgi:transposase